MPRDSVKTRPLAGLRSGLAELAAEQQEESGRRRSAILPRHLRDAAAPPAPLPLATMRNADDDHYSEQSQADYRAGMARVATRLLRARRLLLIAFADDPGRRAAWDLLAGPTVSEKAGRGERQDNEPFVDPEDPVLPNMRQAGMILTAEAGLLADVAGGRDALAGIRQGLASDSTERSDADVQRRRSSAQRCVASPADGSATPNPIDEAGFTPAKAPSGSSKRRKKK